MSHRPSAPACPSENELMVFAAGAYRAETEAHLAECDRCRATVVGLISRSSQPAPRSEAMKRGESIGRYVVLDLVGEGAMGKVYAAYDPVLDRRIALKLIRPLLDHSEMHQRLLREAKALAKVSHPNLVAVHDAGLHEGMVFIAMEYVEGPTLRVWLKSERRSNEAIIEAFLQAGRGLAAIHEAGLVHRDLKPDNILVGRDRVRISDFGLAHEESELAEVKLGSESGSQSGAFVGTPAYMAPEQIQGAKADARSDQFSFALALYEALVGARPFVRNTQAVVQLGPKFVGDRRLVALFKKALAASPEKRFPTVSVMLTVLAPRRPSHLLLTVAAVALSLGLALWALVGTKLASCQSGDRLVANVWNAQRRASIASRFAALGQEALFEGAAAEVDAWSHAWSEQHQEACEATRVRGEQSDHLLELRMACLSRRLVEFEGVLGVLSTTEANTAPRARDALTSMTSLTTCANPEALSAGHQRPESPEVRRRVEEAERLVARAQALKDSGRFREGLPIAAAALEDARSLQWAPLEAEALLLLGELTDGAGQIEDAVPLLRDAWFRAHAGAADRLAVMAAVSLSYVLSEQARMKEAEDWVWQAQAVLPRAGRDWELEARVFTQAGHNRYALSDFRGAEQHYQRAWEVRRDHQGPSHQKTATMLANLAKAKASQGRYAEAVQSLREVTKILEEALGRFHPKVGQAYNAVAELLIEQGNGDEALALIDSILPDQQKALDPQSRYLARLYLGRSFALALVGRLPESLEENARALAVFEQEKMSLMVAVAKNARGNSWCKMGRVGEGLAVIASARKDLIESVGPEHEEVVVTFESEGECLLADGKPAAALSVFEGSLAAREKAGGPDDPWSAMSLSGLGRAHLALGHVELAITPLQRAVALLEKSPLDRLVYERAKFALVKAQRAQHTARRLR